MVKSSTKWISSNLGDEIRSVGSNKCLFSKVLQQALIFIILYIILILIYNNNNNFFIIKFINIPLSLINYSIKSKYSTKY